MTVCTHCKYCGEALDSDDIEAGRRYCSRLHRTMWNRKHTNAVRHGTETPEHTVDYYSKLRALPAIETPCDPPLLAALRLAERDECEHYDRCLHDVACARQRFVPCVGCRAYISAPQPVSILHSNWPDESAFPGREVAA